METNPLFDTNSFQDIPSKQGSGMSEGKYVYGQWVPRALFEISKQTLKEMKETKNALKHLNECECTTNEKNQTLQAQKDKLLQLQNRIDQHQPEECEKRIYRALNAYKNLGYYPSSSVVEITKHCDYEIVYPDYGRLKFTNSPLMYNQVLSTKREQEVPRHRGYKKCL